MVRHSLAGSLHELREYLDGYADRPKLAHARLPFFLFFKQFALARDVASIALGQHIFAHGADLLPCDDAAIGSSLRNMRQD